MSSRIRSISRVVLVLGVMGASSALFLSQGSRLVRDGSIGDPRDPSHAFASPLRQNGNNGNVGGSGDPAPIVAPAPPPAAPRPAPVAAAPAAAVGPTGSPGNCFFILGFADFHRLLNARDGECKTNEYADPNGTGDQHQQTTLPVPNGLMVWEKRTNTMRWTDGNKTYTYSKCLWQERLNTQRFRWEQDPALMEQPGETPPAGACSIV